MNIAKRLRDMFNMFTRIVTGIVAGSSIYIGIFWGWDTDLGIAYLAQVLAVAFVCTIGSNIITGDDGAGPKDNMGIRILLNFILVNIFVLVSGFYFEWFDPSKWKMIIGMEMIIDFVYLFICIACFGVDCRTTNKINKILKRRNLQENEE